MDYSKIAPGVRLEARHAWWVVKKVEATSTKGRKITAVGLSEQVRNHEQIFLTEVEEKFGYTIDVVDPKETEFALDPSQHYLNSRLYLEAQFRNTAPDQSGIILGHKAAMNLEDYQLKPTRVAMGQPRQRILIADAVGLGKTLEAGILTSELIRRGQGKRILVLAVKSMLTQFQKEFWARFTIPLVRLDSVGIEKIRREIPSNQNPFYYFDKSIISIDTLKQDARYRAWIEQAYWDIIIIDEAHNVAERGKSNASMRAKLAKLLSRRSDSLIMLSATPHDGRARSFASLMNMLNPTAIPDMEDFKKEDIEKRGMFIRRFRKHVAGAVTNTFLERQVSCLYSQASHQEEEAYIALKTLELQNLDRNKKPSQLFRVTLEKAFLSSPAACLKTIANRIAKIEKSEDEIAQLDIPLLEGLQSKVKRIDKASFSKYQKLLEHLKAIGFKKGGKLDRLVIFTESVETMRWLYENLPSEIGLKEKHVAHMYGGLSDIEQQRIVEEFGNESSDLRLLIASDVASEGINLHYCCHRLIHFDIPWSLMVFQQRNGRIDRYGQSRTPHIDYFLTKLSSQQRKGDLRVLELLIEKDQEVVKNIGDPSVFTKVNEIEAEEDITARVIIGINSVEEFERQLEPESRQVDSDPMAFLFDFDGKDYVPSEEPSDLPTLFQDDFTYLNRSLDAMRGRRAEEIQFEADTQRQTLKITMNDDLRRVFRKLPKEIRPDKEDPRIFLTPDPERLQCEIVEARKSEQSWPRWQYLWPLNPILDWGSDKNLNLFSRHQAPYLESHRLEKGTLIFVFSGILPDKMAQPLIQAWFGVEFKGTQFRRVLSLEDVIETAGLKDSKLPNRGSELPVKRLRDLISEAVDKARSEMDSRRKAFEDENNPKLQKELDELDALRDRHKKVLGEKAKQRKLADFDLEREERGIDSIFDDFWEWMENSYMPENEPAIQVMAAIAGYDLGGAQ